MADKIDSGLYQEALKQVIAKLERESAPVSALAQPVVSQMRQETAKGMFANAWHTAKRMQADQVRHVAGRKPVEVPAPRPIPGLSPELQKLREESRQRLAETFEKNNRDIHGAFDEHHEKTILGLFTRLGIDTMTAEKVVEEVKKSVRG